MSSTSGNLFKISLPNEEISKASTLILSPSSKNIPPKKNLFKNSSQVIIGSQGFDELFTMSLKILANSKLNGSPNIL